MKQSRSRHQTFARLVLYSFISAVAALVAGACSKSPAAPTPTCEVTLGQVTTAIPAGGIAGSVAVNTASGCAWTATSGATFITITQGATGSGNGAVQFTVAPNIGAARTGTLTVAGTSITFTQAAGIVVTPPGLGAPAAQSPAGGQVVDSLTPTLVVTNAAVTGTISSVTYRFEVSDLDSFPEGSRTLVSDAVSQGSGNTAWTVPQSLAPNTTYFWRARAAGASVTSAFSNAETFRTPNNCSFSLSTTTITTASAGGTSTVNVSTPGTCSWTATSNASFITITSGASGTGNGTVSISVAASSGAARSGTLTIAGQTVTVNQTGSGVVAAFNLLDPSTTSGPTTECWFRNLLGQPSTCTLTSTSFTFGPTAVVSYTWTAQYTYGTLKTVTQTGSNPQLNITDLCGQVTSTNEGATQPLDVTLTVTDSAGNTATATSGTGGQPALAVRLFACGV
jgi:all-beta uncharacterized protein